MELIGASTGQSSGQVWIENHPTEGWLPGRVDSLAANGCYVVVDERGDQFEVPQAQARPVDPACLKGVDDLLDLGDFNEGALLHNIRVRYFKDEIYSGIGGPILISINPYSAIPGLYSEAKQKFYRDRGDALIAGDVKIPPHLFSVGAASYVSMLKDGKNQSIIISGESGAGKTEATKRILTYFASQQCDQTASGGGAARANGEMSIEQQVLRSNPILEAFGNAKTLRNDNSSRFGKFIEIEFDKVGKLRSARISNYLLEKCRIVVQQPDERGYHAFYMLCAGASSLPGGAELGPLDANVHEYTKVLTEVPGVDDRETFQEMVDCMRSLGFSADEEASIFKVVAAVLHLGDMTFSPGADANEGCKVVDDGLPARISGLLGVDVQAFSKIFQFKTLEDPFTKKIIDMPQEVPGASNTRHSMAKVVYSRLFDWLVWRINQSTMAKGGGVGPESRKIGILDIYGFEVFDWNSFEQLCINFANEKLQQHFNSHMFTLEQQLYTEEGIAWSHIQFQDNREIIDSLEKRPLGLFCIVDSECLMPNATETSCLNKILNSFKTSKIVYKPSRFASSNFAVAHYAGEVVYDIVSFLEKNTDKLHADIMNLLKGSGIPLIKSLFTDARFAPELAAAGAAGGAGAAGARGGAPSRPGMRPAAGAAGRAAGAGDSGGRAKQNVTVSMAFRQQLDQLVDDLNKTNPRYIRCIKPNALKAAHEFDSLDVQRQLRCAGMLESIRIRRAGYSVRRPFKEFFNRFRVLTPSLTTAGRLDPDYKELSRKLLQDMEAKMLAEKTPIEAKSWQIGRSKVFLKEELQGKLEQRIGTAVAGYVVKLQKRWRGFFLRKRYRNMRRAASALQAALRAAAAAAAFQAERERHRASVVLQTALRAAAERYNFERKRRGALTGQRLYRGWKTRQKIGRLKGKMAQDRIQKLREEESRNAALEEARRAAEANAKALEDMQKQMALERERVQEEARREFEARQRPPPPASPEAASDGGTSGGNAGSPVNVSSAAIAEKDAQLEALRKETQAMRMENARLQGQIDAGGAGSSRAGGAGATSADAAELEQLRRDLQTLRREKVHLEVELSTAKSPAEFDAMVTETLTLREEGASLRRAKQDAEKQLEQVGAELEGLRAQATRGQQAVLELDVLRMSHSELQVQKERLEAQKAALEERAQGEEAVHVELAELRLEKVRLAGELETSKLREEAIAEKLRGAERTSADLLQQKQRCTAAEAELEGARKQVEKLREQIAQASRDGGAARADSMEQLRNELLARIEAKPAPTSPQARPSIPPPGGLEERGSLLGQRALFEQIKQQSAMLKAGGAQASEGNEDATLGISAELEEELRQAREENAALKKENVELTISVRGLKDDLAARESEAGEQRGASAMLQAEIQDLKFQLSSEVSSGRRLSAEADEARARLGTFEGELAALRGRQRSAEERADIAEGDLRAARQRCDRLQREKEAVEARSLELQQQAVDADSRARGALQQVEEHRQAAEHFKKQNEGGERRRSEVENSNRWLESENERLRAENADAQAEKAKIKEMVNELLQADNQNRSEELQREVSKYKTRAEYFEREYNKSKELNKDMTAHMSQMLQAVNERQDESGDLAQQNRLLKKQLESKAQELKVARAERETSQRELDGLHANGTYFQEKYREASNEVRRLQQEHSTAAASLAKLRERVEGVQQENEELKARNAKLLMEAHTNSGEAERIQKYEHHVRELQTRMRAKEVEAENSKEQFMKSQKVNDHLNTLLVLESEQSSLYESCATIQDERVRGELGERKRRAQVVIGRLHEMLNDDERMSITSLNRTQPGGAAAFAPPAHPHGGHSGYHGGLDHTWAGPSLR